MKRAAEGGDGYGYPAKRGGKGGSSGSSDKGLPKTRHAFKVLLTDNLVVSLLGTRGSVKDEIQNATGAKLVFSNRGDYFPGSHYRVLGIFADDSSCICQTFDWILPKIAELAVEESKNPPKDGPELLGKEPGEYIFRFCVTKRMSSHIIGTGGANIKKIRNDTGAKVFIDNETHMNHRLCRIIGTPEQILPCLEQSNEYVQQDCDEQEYPSTFAGIVNFGEAAANGWAPGPESREAPWAAGGGEGRGGRGVLVPPPKAARGNTEAAVEVTLGTLQEEVDGLAEVLHGFPPGTPQLQYSVGCGLPPKKVGALIGKAGEYVKYVEEATGTTIDIEHEKGAEAEAPRTMTIVGQLVNVYTAHAMMLMKLRATEAREQEEAERQRAKEASEDPAALKARIQELQAQLATVSSQIGKLM